MFKENTHLIINENRKTVFIKRRILLQILSKSVNKYRSYMHLKLQIVLT